MVLVLKTGGGLRMLPAVRRGIAGGFLGGNTDNWGGGERSWPSKRGGKDGGSLNLEICARTWDDRMVGEGGVCISGGFMLLDSIAVAAVGRMGAGGMARYDSSVLFGGRAGMQC